MSIPSKEGLFCRHCPIFVPGCVGGINKTVALKQLVTQPLKTFKKLLGQDGVLATHSQNKYHIDAVKAGNDFLKAYHNPQLDVANQMNTQHLKQVSENRERLRPIVENLLFMGLQNIPLRGHRDDGALLDEFEDPMLKEGNFRELLRLRVAAGDTTLEHHLKTASSRAT